MCVATVLTGLGAPSPQSAAAERHAPRSESVRLRGTTVFSASTTSSWSVHVPKDLDASAVRTTYRGDGRIYGFVMQGLDGPTEYAPQITGYTTGRCAQRGCKSRKPHFNFQFRSNLEEGRLPAGAYAVTVIADSAPTSFTIRASQLKGVARHDQGERTNAHIATLPVHLGAGGQENVFSAGKFHELSSGSADLGLFGIWLQGRNHVVSGYGDCAYYRGDLTRTLPPTAFAPGCPTGDGFEHSSVSDPPGERSGNVLMVGRFGSHENPVDGQGGWFASVSELERYGAVGAWIDLP